MDYSEKPMKRKMQNVSFNSIDEFLEFLSGEELKMVEALRNLIFDCVPGIHEKLSYNVPFYRKNKGMFFIWPASVYWGKKKSYNGVRFGFQQGNLLADEIKYLDQGERKQVFWKDFQSLKDVDVQLLKAYIFETEMIDRAFGKEP